MSVSIDFVAGKIGVQSGQTPMTEFNATDGVDVDLRLGVLHAAQTIIMTEAHGGRVVYQQPSTP